MHNISDFAGRVSRPPLGGSGTATYVVFRGSDRGRILGREGPDLVTQDEVTAILGSGLAMQWPNLCRTIVDYLQRCVTDVPFTSAQVRWLTEHLLEVLKIYEIREFSHQGRWEKIRFRLRGKLWDTDLQDKIRGHGGLMYSLTGTEADLAFAASEQLKIPHGSPQIRVMQNCLLITWFGCVPYTRDQDMRVRRNMVLQERMTRARLLQS